MKKRIFAVFVFTLVIDACNNGDKSTKDNDMSKMNTDTAKSATVDTTQIAEVAHSFNNVDSKLAASIKAIVDHYLHIKNALVDNDGREAATGGKEMAEAISKVDKSLLTVEQKKLYDDIEDDLKEHAEHIGANGNKIEHQREHFTMMSEDVYDLVKASGGGQ